MMLKQVTAENFSSLRYGMFLHYGLFSQQARGEWVMNREKIAPVIMKQKAKGFSPAQFDARAICQLALEAGMRYLIFTTMHHDGFRLYDSQLSSFNSMQACKRDLTAEIVAAARQSGLKIGLYHSLNNWYDKPDAVKALEIKSDYRLFIKNTMARLQELVEKFNPIDILWYDGWWPFNEKKWQAEEMNAKLRKIQPQLLFNGRNGLPGDFATPEKHISPPSPWRPWEACMTLNDHWGYHQNDHNWKSPLELVKMLLQCGNGKGNLLLNVGPRGDGSMPSETLSILRQVGNWCRNGGWEALATPELMSFGPGMRQPDEHSDWDSNGVFSASGKRLYFTLLYASGSRLTLSGLEMSVHKVSSFTCPDLPFRQQADCLTLELPEQLLSEFCPVLRFDCDRTPSIYRCGGLSRPQVEHPRYDPVKPDLQY